MSESTLLIICSDPFIIADVAWWAKKAGFAVSPIRHQEPYLDALSRVRPEFVLVHVRHGAHNADDLLREASALHACVLGFEIDTNRSQLTVHGQGAHKIGLRPGNEAALYTVLREACVRDP